jgi:glycosyltransferase involved in cell wall biosynthesis
VNAKRNITVFLESLDGGGAEYAILTLLNALAGKGCSVELILCKSGGVYRKQLSPDVILVELNSKSLYYCLPKLVKHLKHKKPPVLLTTLDLSNLITLIARRLARVKTRVIIRVANTVSLQERTWLKKRLERLLLGWIYPWADVIVAVSGGVADDLAKYIAMPRERILTIYNPVITPRLKELADIRPNHPWFGPSQPPVILGVGRLNKQKGFETLIKAFAKVHSKQPARLLILGKGEQRAYLESLVGRLGLNNEVSMPGFVENPFQYMKHAGVFVLSSAWEGLPAVLIQALACGCPVVSTDCPSGPNEILDRGKYGRLVPVGDEEAMAEAILQTLSGPKSMPDHTWLERFSLDYIVEQYLKVLGSN